MVDSTDRSGMYKSCMVYRGVVDSKVNRSMVD
jgi:hypothetical protein